MRPSRSTSEQATRQAAVRVVAVVVAAAILAVSLGGCGGNSPAVGNGPPPLTHITLWLDWTPWGVHVPIYAAQEEGYFRRQNLDVSIRVPADVTDPLKLVASNADTIGIGYMSDVVSAEAAGVPVVSIAALVQHHLNCIMTLKSSGIISPKQLAGKSVGQGGTPADKVILDTVFKHAGVTGKVRLVNLNYPYVPALLDGRVDAIEGAYQVWEKIQIEQTGHAVNVIQLRPWGVPDEYELVMLAGKSMIRSRPGVLRRFMRALTMGANFALHHPGHAVHDFLAANPSDDSDKALIRQSWHLLTGLVEPRSGRFGSQNGARWSHLASWMYTNHLVSKDVKPADLYTDRFVAG